MPMPASNELKITHPYPGERLLPVLPGRDDREVQPEPRHAGALPPGLGRG